MRDQGENNKRKEKGDHQVSHHKRAEMCGTEETNRLHKKSAGEDDNI